MKKKHAKTIRQIVDAVGEVTTENTEWVPISGRDLQLSGYGKTNPHIDPNRMYEISIPVTYYHSPKKDLKRQLKKAGHQGLVDYVRKIHDERVTNP